MLAVFESALLWTGALGFAAMAGIYFAFSSFIMRAFADLPDADGVAAMRSINRVILRSSFMPLFFGTTLVAVAAVVWAAVFWNPEASPLIAAGGALYVVGMFVSTAARNVPLNTALDADAALWPRYLSDWTRWNSLRAAASAASAGLFIAALTLA